jgi:uncharacterized cupin superfamily protein
MPGPNIFDPQFEDGERPDGFRSRRARIGYELGSELVGISVFELPPGEAAYPYHFHYADEEVVIVLEGRPTLRDPDGTRELAPGEAVRFPLGEDGAHQLRNDTPERVRFLALSSSGRPDVIVYPDSNKVGVGERLPRGGGLRAFFPADTAVDYWHGEGRPPGGAPRETAEPPSPSG